MEKDNKEQIPLKENDQKEVEKETIKLPVLISKDEINNTSGKTIEITQKNEIQINDKDNDANKTSLLNKKRERDSLESNKEGEQEDEDEKTEKKKEKNSDTPDNENKKDQKDNIEENKIIPLIEEKNIIIENNKKNETNVEKKENEKKEEEKVDKNDEKKEEKLNEKKEEKINEKREEKIDEKKDDIKEEKKENEKGVNNQENKNPSNLNEKEKNIKNNNDTNTNTRKRVTFKEAQQSIKDFMALLNETEEKIKAKYGNCLPDFSCEDQLPISWRTKLINKFFESEEMKNIVNKMQEEQIQKK